MKKFTTAATGTQEHTLVKFGGVLQPDLLLHLRQTKKLGGMG